MARCQKLNSVIDIRGKEAILGVMRNPLAQQMTRLFQQRTAGQPLAHIQPLDRGQPLHGLYAAGVFRHRPQTTTGSRPH